MFQGREENERGRRREWELIRGNNDSMCVGEILSLVLTERATEAARETQIGGEIERSQGREK